MKERRYRLTKHIACRVHLLFLGCVSIAWGQYDNGIVSYGGLNQTGLTAAEVTRGAPAFVPARPRPPVRYLAQGPKPTEKGTVDFASVPIQLKGGFSHIGVGFPLERGAVFDLGKIQIRQADEVLPTQITALALWPDGSIKSAFLQWPKSSENVSVEFGNQVNKPSPASTPLSISETETEFLVATGKIQVHLRKDSFEPFAQVLSVPQDGEKAEDITKPDSTLQLVDAKGKTFIAGAPESFTIERQGPYDLVLRAEGKYRATDGTTFMRYISRLRFVAGQSRVEWTLTHINDELKTEFSDIRELIAHIAFASSGKPAIALVDGIAKSKSYASLAQWDENTFETDIDGAKSTKRGRPPGVALLEQKTKGQYLGVEDFWQRWPKSISASKDGFTVGLLPAQPDSSYGKDLPYHLMFPFVEGCYRMKWGMAFTERIVVDFDSTESAQDFVTALNQAAIPILPPDYIAKTKVFGDVGNSDAAGAREFSRYMGASLKLHLQQREKQREYGFFNWGDWFGERGRNWGNNEYDRAHGFFTYYLLSGQADFQREAHTAARHQADVDIVHAYPDPYYIGANPQHSVGHTGVWSERIKPATWSYAYDSHTNAGNGHTWTDGMADAWLLTGDPVVMESMLALGEHIAFAFAPSFSKVGSHERSAGWSLRAAMGAYRATSDPAYLEAARSIAAVPMAQWDQENGVKAHELPADHASGLKGVYGNSVYNIGILLMGLAELHRETKDERILSYMTASAEWLAKSWNPQAFAWPYSCDSEGRPLTPLAPNLNPLLYPSLAYLGQQTSNKRFSQIANDAFVSTFPPGSRDLLAKEFSIKSFASTETLGALSLAARQGLIPATADYRDVFLQTVFPSEASFRDASPGTFDIRPLSEKASLRLDKIVSPTPGAQPASIIITKDDQSVLEKFDIPSSQKTWNHTWELPAGEEDRFRITFDGKSNEAFRLTAKGCDVSLPGPQSLALRDKGIRTWELILPNDEGAILEFNGLGAGAFFPGYRDKIERKESDAGLQFTIPSGRQWQDRPSKLRIIAWNNELLRVTLRDSAQASLRLISNAPLADNHQSTTTIQP